MSESRRTPKEQELVEAKLAAEIAALKAKAKSELAGAKVGALQAENLDREIAWDRDGNSAQRIFNFIGGIQESTAINCANTLNVWARQSNEPITILLNSPGGGVFAGFALIDAINKIREQGIHVTVVVRGMAASMGGVLLQCGDTRIIGANAHLMIHEASTASVGKTSELEDTVEFTKRLQARILDILAERSTMTAGQIKRRWQRKDWWLDAEETVRLGFADVVG